MHHTKVPVFSLTHTHTSSHTHCPRRGRGHKRDRQNKCTGGQTDKSYVGVGGDEQWRALVTSLWQDKSTTSPQWHRPASNVNQKDDRPAVTSREEMLRHVRCCHRTDSRSVLLCTGSFREEGEGEGSQAMAWVTACDDGDGAKVTNERHSFNGSPWVVAVFSNSSDLDSSF